MDLFAPFKAGKDILVAGKNALLERFLKHGLGEAGTVSNLMLDSSAKTLTFDLALKGEADSLPIAIAYLVEHNAHGTWVIIREVKPPSNGLTSWQGVFSKSRPRCPTPSGWCSKDLHHLFFSPTTIERYDHPTETKELLLQLRERIPPERRAAFVAAVNKRVGELASSHAAYYTLLGGLSGYLLGHLPLVGLLTHHHETEIGAALGAWVSLTKDHAERERRESLQSIVQEAIHHALA